MADSETSKEDRTVDPSGKKIADARAKGNVARSRQLDHALLLATGGLGLLALGPSMSDAAVRVFRGAMQFDVRTATETGRMVERFEALVLQMLLACTPLVALLVVAAAASPLAVGGWNFAGDVLMPKLERLDPLGGLAKFFGVRSVVELGKTIFITVVAGAIGYNWFTGHIEQFASLAMGDLRSGIAQSMDMALAVYLLMIGVLVVVAAVDVPWQLHQYKQQLMMTPEESKREAKEAEVSPEVKGKIKARARELARQRMMKAVPTASVVVTNPTHFAVALKYDEGRHGAPVVVAKGADAVAARIRELAVEHRVPMLSAPPLARALHQHVDIGNEIPAALYNAVAMVLAYVFQLQRHAAGAAPAPQSPDDIEVPEGMDPGMDPGPAPKPGPDLDPELRA